MNDLIPINEPGKYTVTIFDPAFYPMPEKDGIDYRFSVRLPGRTEDGKTITAEMFFTPTLAKSGQHAGKTMAEINAEKLFELGMEPPFHPDRLIDLEGVECEYDVQYEEYDGRERLRVKWVNKHSIKPLQAEDVSRMWAKLTGKSQDAAPTVQDDLPF
ncbi:MAG: hypothetical protein OEQ39_02855 [Gammaproteobacteria bacterium]|nr:hypothetical protein [Gammaproteobacteria bacterium]MDH3375889.1 hypothetical protein [Gammaproteobacteria bacterium]